MKKSKCCNAQATVSGHTTKYYVCHCCGKACDLGEFMTKEEMFEKITPKKTDTRREFGELLAEILAKHENDINNIKQQMK